MYVLNKAELLAIADAETAMGGTLNGAKIALYTNNVYPSKGMAIGDFTIANFGGLTNQKAITWGAPFLNANLQAEVLGTLLNWLTTAGTGLPVTAYGYVIVNSGATDWLLAERFATTVEFSESGQNQGLIPRLVFDS